MPNRIIRAPLSAIRVGTRLRALREPGIVELAESMRARGLLQPIAVTYSNGPAHPDLVFGAHRLEAAKRLRWDTIDAIVMSPLDADAALLAEIDENLIRGELTPAERAVHGAERKRLYEAIHPETRQGGAPGKAGGGKVAKMAKTASFATDQAQKTGRSDRAVRADVERARKIPRILDCAGTSLDQGAELDALAKLPVERQNELIARARAGEKVSAKHAAKQMRRAELERELADATRAASQSIGCRLYGVIYADPPWIPAWIAPLTITIRP
jgi:ParB-like chromosome segregation protein Spo0J